MDSKPIILEHNFQASVARVWEALTETESLQKWYFNISNFSPIEGFKFQFEGGEPDNRYVHLCEVIEVIPQKKLKYSWAYEGHEGHSVVTFEVTKQANTTSLKLRHQGLETFNNPDFKKEKFIDGWNFLLNESLRAYLERGEAMRYW